MALPVSVGDFIALADHAHKLYIDVYKVARAAPEHLKGLDKELASLSQSVSLLVDEINNPKSLINQAGTSHAEMLLELKDRTQETLSSLAKLAQKHELAKGSARQASKVKRGWGKLMFAKDARSVDALRSKLVYHNSAIQLLLTAAGNSSLQRMHNEQVRMAEAIQEIKGLVLTPEKMYPKGTADGVETSKGQRFDANIETDSSKPSPLTNLIAWVCFKGKRCVGRYLQRVKR